MILPIGLRLFPSLTCFGLTKVSSFRIWILILTFISYTSYHLSRRPLSVVKNILSRNCSQLDIPSNVILSNTTTTSNWCDWKPFGGDESNTLLGLLDSSFLFSYAIGMFFSGFIAERCHLRYFLSLGMLLSGIFTYLFGIAFYYNIHSYYYFVFVQIICGALQTTGWPAVVSCVGNWFGKSSRGLIFGIWNSHTNFGNILGAVIAGSFVEYNWGLSFIVPGIIISVSGFIMFLFLAPYPEEVGVSPYDIDASRKVKETLCSFDDNCEDSNDSISTSSSSMSHNRRKMKPIEDANDDSLLVDEEEHPLLSDSNIKTNNDEIHAISFITALKIPGVIEFSLCLFFAKLVSYTFLYWLPLYIRVSTDSSSSDSAYLSTPFDLGGIFGAIVAGYLVDKTGASAIICIVMLVFAVPSLFLYQLYGSASNFMNIALQLIAGSFVNGPYALITTAVSAELGTKVSNSHALATVTAIIDGTGSIGAAIGPFMAGLVSETGWANVFYMVMIADFLALSSLLRIAAQEWKRITENRRRNNENRFIA